MFTLWSPSLPSEAFGTFLLYEELLYGPLTVLLPPLNLLARKPLYLKCCLIGVILWCMVYVIFSVTQKYPVFSIRDYVHAPTINPSCNDVFVTVCSHCHCDLLCRDHWSTQHFWPQRDTFSSSLNTLWSFLVYNGCQLQFSLISTALSHCSVGFILFYLFVFCLVSSVSTTLGLLSIIHFVLCPVKTSP